MTWKDGSSFLAFRALRDVTRPDLSGVTIHDIAWTLARICRYGGHLRLGVDFYSVAQHSVIVSRLVPPELALTGLLHDAAEAVLGDMIRPIKILLPDYQALEAKWEAAIAARWRLAFPFPPEIKRADLVALATERRDLLDPVADDSFWGAIKPMPGRIDPLSPLGAANLFMHTYRSLTE